MLRKILACLALLTGLTAAGAPVQAEVAVALASQIEASIADEAVTQAAAPTGAAQPAATKRAKAGSPKALFPRLLRKPSVYLGSDRARE